MKVGLITPVRTGKDTNVGTAMITAGIRYLVREATGAAFDEIEMYEDIPSHWQRAEQCDAVLFCGNPRFTENPTGEWWDYGIWPRLVDLSRRVLVVDAWSGSCVGLTNARDSVAVQTAIIRNELNKGRFDAARSLAHNIARDSVMAAAYRRERIRHTLLPCSSYWARNEYGFEPHTGEDDLLVLADVAGHTWIAEKIKSLLATLARPRVMACSWQEYHWAQANGINAEFVFTPSDMFRVFSECATVRSFRIHAVIPAASMGCKVGMIAIDSRYLTCEPFAIPSVTLQEWHDGAHVDAYESMEPAAPIEAVARILGVTASPLPKSNLGDTARAGYSQTPPLAGTP